MRSIKTMDSDLIMVVLAVSAMLGLAIAPQLLHQNHETATENETKKTSLTISEGSKFTVLEKGKAFNDHKYAILQDTKSKQCYMHLTSLLETSASMSTYPCPAQP